MRPENGERSSPRCSLIYSINGGRGRGGEGRASLPGRRLTAKIVAFARLLSLGIYIYIYIYIFHSRAALLECLSRFSREQSRRRGGAGTSESEHPVYVRAQEGITVIYTG